MKAKISASKNQIISNIDDRIYGSMLLGIENDESKVQKALDFIKKAENVFYEEV